MSDEPTTEDTPAGRVSDCVLQSQRLLIDTYKGHENTLYY